MIEGARWGAEVLGDRPDRDTHGSVLDHQRTSGVQKVRMLEMCSPHV